MEKSKCRCWRLLLLKLPPRKGRKLYSQTIFKKISIDLHYNGHNSFYSSLMKMTDYCNFCDFNCISLNEGKIKQYEDLIKKYIYLLLEPNPSTFAKT